MKRCRRRWAWIGLSCLAAAPWLAACGRGPTEVGEAARGGESGGRDVGSVVGRELPDDETEEGRRYPSVFGESAQQAGRLADRAREEARGQLPEAPPHAHDSSHGSRSNSDQGSSSTQRLRSSS